MVRLACLLLPAAAIQRGARTSYTPPEGIGATVTVVQPGGRVDLLPGPAEGPAKDLDASFAEIRSTTAKRTVDEVGQVHNATNSSMDRAQRYAGMTKEAIVQKLIEAEDERDAAFHSAGLQRHASSSEAGLDEVEGAFAEGASAKEKEIHKTDQVP